MSGGGVGEERLESLLVEHLPSTYKALDSIHGITKPLPPTHTYTTKKTKVLWHKIYHNCLEPYFTIHLLNQYSLQPTPSQFKMVS
jgi:hypothetical protein